MDGGECQVFCVNAGIPSQRIPQPIGDIPPAEYEANCYRDDSPVDTAGFKQNTLRSTRTGSGGDPTESDDVERVYPGI